MTTPDDDPISERAAARLARLGAQFRALERTELLAREGRANELDGEAHDGRELGDLDGARGAETRDQEDGARAGDGAMHSGEVLRRARRGRYLRGRLAGGRTRAATVVGLLCIAAAVVVVSLNHAPPAGASSPITRAPVLAERAGSVRFRSTVHVVLGRQLATTYSEAGAVNFATGNYETSLRFGHGALTLEHRGVNGVLYIRNRSGGHGGSAARWKGLAPPRRTHHEPRYTLIDPQVVLRVLAQTTEPARVVGRRSIGGVRLVEYQARTTFRSFVAAQEGRVFKRALTRQPPAPDIEGTLDVWLDPVGRPHSVLATFAGPSRHGQAALAIALTFTGYGAPVSPVRPKGARLSRGAPRAGASGADPTRTLMRVLFGGARAQR